MPLEKWRAFYARGWWMDGGTFKVCIQLLFAFLFLRCLLVAMWPAWRKKSRWGRCGKERPPVSIYGALAWAGMFAALFAWITLGVEWAWLAPVGFGILLFAALMDVLLHRKRKGSDSTNAT